MHGDPLPPPTLMFEVQYVETGFQLGPVLGHRTDVTASLANPASRRRTLQTFSTGVYENPHKAIRSLSASTEATSSELALGQQYPLSVLLQELPAFVVVEEHGEITGYITLARGQRLSHAVAENHG